MLGRRRPRVGQVVRDPGPGRDAGVSPVRAARALGGQGGGPGAGFFSRVIADGLA